MGVLAQVFFDYSGDVAAKWFERFSYTRAVVSSGVVFAAGFVCAILLTRLYFLEGYRLPEASPMNYLGFTGLMLMIEGFMTFTFTLILHSTAVAVRRR